MNASRPDIALRPSDERGAAIHGWLRSQHSFSFAEYYDPQHMGFRSLRVINQDEVDAGRGFGAHPHRDMEIFSYVLHGALEHKDSLGNARQLNPGEIQLMSAETGVSHSEYNPSSDEALHFLQIWIEPAEKGLPPKYTEWIPDESVSDAGKVLIISPDGQGDSAVIRQDARVYRVRLKPGASVEHELVDGRGLWLQVIRGPLTLSHTELAPGDGASAETAGSYVLQAGDAKVEALLFDFA